MKRILALVLTIIALAILAFVITKFTDLIPPSSHIVETHALVLEEVEALGKMELVRYHFQDVVTHEVVRTWFPDPAVVLFVKGEAVGCIDFAKIDSANIQLQGDTAQVFLPVPELCYVKIDHQRSKIFDTRYTFFEPASLVDDAYKAAEREIKETALQEGMILEQTRSQAVLILEPMLGALAGKPVKVFFEQSEPILVNPLD